MLGDSLLLLCDPLGEGERRRGERWEQREEVRGCKGESGVVSGTGKGKRRREKQGWWGMVENGCCFFASKQTGDILKRGLLSPFVYSTCPFLEAFGSWETLSLVTRDFEHGGVFLAIGVCMWKGGGKLEALFLPQDKVLTALSGLLTTEATRRQQTRHSKY